MAIIKSVRGFSPKYGENCFFAENSVVIGDVTMGNDCSVWFNAVVRGDVNSIIIGNKVNIQDGVVIHTTYQKTKTILGDNVSLGHNAVVHGATISKNVLVGIGAIVLDNAQIGENTIVAAGSLVKEGQILDSDSIYAGVPAKKIKEIDPKQTQHYIKRIANNYLIYSDWYKDDNLII